MPRRHRSSSAAADGVVEPLPRPRIVARDARGPEHVALDGAGRILTGTADGAIWRLTLSETAGLARGEVIAETGGRPLGMVPSPDGELLVCDARRGLLRVDPRGGTVGVLADEVDGVPLRFCSNVATSADCTLYFTVSSRRYALEDWLSDILEDTGTGRLLRLRPGGEPEVLRDGLRFANGVALAPDESFVAVAESGARRIRRHWLTGRRTGTDDTLVADLPGYPDNLSRGADGVFWVALAGPREPAVDALHHASPALRRAASTAVRRFRPHPRPTVRVLAIRPDGSVARHLLLRRSPYRMATSVCEHGSRLVLGSLLERGIAVCG
ncbi:SMP-30/gluconolactonase/LRE family protein [Streptomyces sp. Rer75]|uniref:SMP-30/gluconolactonase/LRE family protein n=1 Tax=Streptomyces sp. Rer75 TaxID=2750011 RepID=UPI0015D0C352|nr:SMP-30/gluconolactonase/LRE family protein [Streptomyces sp. Rer75]QLH25595.1 SMP-30/gluconolactonase/LRE family protein [Streptomyces sp. Rer75]